MISPSSVIIKSASNLDSSSEANTCSNTVDVVWVSLSKNMGFPSVVLFPRKKCYQNLLCGFGSIKYDELLCTFNIISLVQQIFWHWGAL